MPRGTVATIITDRDDRSGLDAAITTARRLSLHLDVLCLAPACFDPPPPTMADGFDMAAIIARDDTIDLQECEASVTRRLSRTDIDWSVSAKAAGPDALGQGLARHLRFADLVLLPLRGMARTDAMRLFECVLYSSRVPILLSDRGLDRLDHVVVAWDESDVALAAVRAAEPILSTGREVELVTVDLPGAGEDVARMLARRGIAPLLTPLSRGPGSIAETLTDHARSARADLIVAGAYGHTRLRDLILGGVTRDLLRQTELPLLLAR